MARNVMMINSYQYGVLMKPKRYGRTYSEGVEYGRKVYNLWREAHPHKDMKTYLIWLAEAWQTFLSDLFTNEEHEVSNVWPSRFASFHFWVKSGNFHELEVHNG